MRLPRISKKFTGVLAAIFLLAGLGIFGAFAPAQADTAVPGFIASALASIAQVLIELIGKVLIVLIQILLAIVQYNDFINAPAVVKTWVLVRDLGNMAFLVIFIAIAFATILGIEKYEYKQLLPKLLLMAVLINFSRTICGLIIDAAQVVMITFVNGFKEVAAGNLIRGFGLTDMLTLRDLGAQESGISDSALAAASILAVVLLIIATVTVGVIVLMFLIRVIYLWILVALSPAAFLLAAAPGLSGKFSEWWSQFTRYVIIGPVMAFFLWMSFSIMASVKPGENLAQSSNIQFGDKVNTAVGSGGVDTRVSATITEVGRADNLLSYGMAIALLLLSLTVAQEIGVKGGALAGAALAKIQSGGLKLGKLAGLTVATGGLGAVAAAGLFGTKRGREVAAWGARKIQAGKVPLIGKWTKGLQLNPMEIWKGIKESREEKKKFEEMEGRAESGAMMEKGGIKGLLFGLGSSRDWADAYMQGFLYQKGIRRMARTAVGRGTGADYLAEEDKERIKAEEAEGKAKMRREALAKGDYIAEGKDQDIENRLQTEADRVRAKRESGRESGVEVDENYIWEEQVVRDKQGVPDYNEDGSFKMKRVKIKSIDQAMEDLGVVVDKTVDQLRAEGRTEEADAKKLFLEEWDKDQARTSLTKDADAKIAEFAKKGKEASPEVQQFIERLNQVGKNQVLAQSTKKTAEAARLQKGQLSDEEIEKNNRRLRDLQYEIARLNAEIKNKGQLGMDTSKFQVDLGKLVKERDETGTLNSTTNRWEARNDIDKKAELIKKITDDKEKTKEQKKKEIKEIEKDYEKSVREATLESERLQLLGTADDLRTRRAEVENEIDGFVKEGARRRTSADKAGRAAATYVPPRAFYATRDRRLLENEEMKKITTELDTELIAAFRDAVDEGNNIKATAIAKKLANDYNDNELWNAYGFTSNSQGMGKFIDAVLIGKKGIKRDSDDTVYTGPSLGMDEQTALAIQNDISFINEAKNHWETARTIEVENGRYKRVSERQHTKLALAEILKKEASEIVRNFNRLNYGGEKPRADGSGRDFELAPLGLALAKAFGTEFIFRFGRGEYDKNAIINIGAPDILKIFAKYGADERFLKLAADKFNAVKRTGGGTSAGSIVDSFYNDYVGREL